MANRALRPLHLLDLTVLRASQRLSQKGNVRGAHSRTVDSAFASQLGVADMLATNPVQERNPDNASLYSMFVSTYFV